MAITRVPTSMPANMLVGDAEILARVRNRSKLPPVIADVGVPRGSDKSNPIAASGRSWISRLLLLMPRFKLLADGDFVSDAPLGLIGVVAALLIFQAPLGFVAILGVIALCGMIMRNSVILIDQVQTEMDSGRDPWNAVLEAAVRRTRPVVLTAAATVLAMIPLTHSIFWGPMALAIMGGLTVATVLTIFFLPALYAAWFKVKRQPAPAQEAKEVVAGDPALA